MSIWKFYGKWIHLAFTGRLWLAERVEFLATAILGAVAAIWFKDNEMAIVLMAGVPAAVLLGTIIIGLVLAPYWIYKDSQVPDNTATPTNHGPLSLRDQIRHFIDEGRELRTLCIEQGADPPNYAVENWARRVRDFLSSNFTEQQGESWYMRSRGGRPKVGFTGVGQPQQINIWNSVSTGLELLEEIESHL